MKRILLIYFLLGCSQAMASVVNYDEAISGDLPFGPQTPLMIFDVGINTISGSMWYSGNSGNFQYDRDSIRFTIPSGTRIDSVFLTIDNIQLSNINLLEILGYISCGLCNSTIDQRVDLLDPPTDPILWYSGDSDFPAGTHEFSVTLTPEFIGGSSPAEASWDYGIAIHVAPIPLPGAIWLFASGIAFLLGTMSVKVEDEPT